MKNIVLIGMSGAGKSTLGVLLAKAINKNFIDTDLIIQLKHNQVLSEIIRCHGVKTFKNFEEDMLMELQASHAVIATGGSVIYSKKGMKKLKELGIVVYLHVEYDVIAQRLSDITSRGVAIEEGQTLEGLYKEREPLYRQYADIIIDVGSESVEMTLDKIIKIIQ